MTYIPSLVRFFVAGGTSFFLNLIATTLLHEIFNWAEEFAYGVSLISVSLPMFILCRNFVFNSRGSDFRRQLIEFYKSWIIFRICEYLVFLMIFKWTEVFYIYAIIGAHLAFVIAKFIFWRRSVFATQSI